MIFDLTDALAGLAGGTLIGLAGALFLLGSGRIAGISGILGGLLDRAVPRLENTAFLAGLIIAPVIWVVIANPVEITVTEDPALLVSAGLLVGLGTRIGNGCTSGHGVCGLSRLSGRSLAATLTFMAVAVGAATLLRPVVGG